MEPDSVISPNSSSRPRLFLFLLFFLACLILLVEGVYYWRSVKKSPTSEVTLQPNMREMEATANIDVFLSLGEGNVGYFVPGQKFTLTGEQEGNRLQVKDPDGYELWIKKGSSYGPIKK